MSETEDLTRVVCCFCGETIERFGDVSCGLILITNWWRPKERRGEEQFWCHGRCFREKVHRSVPIYELDFPEDEPD